MYIATGAISEEEAREKELLLREREVKVQERGLWWDRIQGLAIGVIPILAFFGWKKWK